MAKAIDKRLDSLEVFAAEAPFGEEPVDMLTNADVKRINRRIEDATRQNETNRNTGLEAAAGKTTL